MRCLAEGAAAEPTSGGRRHNTIIVRFEEFLEANLNRPLYLAEICAAIGVAERTLRLPCEAHLGMGQSVFSPCAACISRIAHCCALIRRSQPSLALSPIRGFGSSVVFQSPIARCSGSPHRRRCSALRSNSMTFRAD